MTTDTVLTSADKDNFVSDLVDYGTDFVAPLYAVIESIEQAVLQSPEVQAMRKDARRYQAARAAMVNYHDDTFPGLLADYAEKHFADQDNPTPAEVDAAFDAAMEKQP